MLNQKKLMTKILEDMNVEVVSNGSATGYSLLVVQLKDATINSKSIMAVIPCVDDSYIIPCVLDNGSTVFFCQFTLKLTSGTLSTEIGSFAGLSSTVYARSTFNAPTIQAIYGIK